MPNDHYIPQFLTRPWEHGERRLTVLDFRSGTVSEEPARRLFAKRGLNAPEVEHALNVYVETPGGLLAHRLRTGSNIASLSPTDWPTIRALALLFLLNPQRLEEARGESSTTMSMAELLARGEQALDEAARWTLSRFEFSSLRLPDGQELFFTEVANFPIPQPALPLLAIPLGLNVLLIIRDRAKPDQIDFLHDMTRRGTVHALSLGIGGNAHRVILPPRWREAHARDPLKAVNALRGIREAAGEICKTVAAAGRLAGVATWDVS